MTIGGIQISGVSYPINLCYVKNQSIGISASGTVKVSSGSEDLFLIIKIDRENSTVAQNLRAFIRNNANYSANIFSIVPDPNIDVGNGNGNAITVRYWADNLDYISDHGDLFSFEFIFRKEIS